MSVEQEVTRRKFLGLCLGAAGGITAAILPFSAIESVASGLESLAQSVPQPVEISEFQTTVLTYHEVTAARLKSDLVARLQRGEQPIALETMIHYLNGEWSAPEVPTFLVTCDDGLLSQYDAVLEAIDYIQDQSGWFIPVTFFALTKLKDFHGPFETMPGNTPCYNDGVHKYMTKNQLINLIQRGHRVENHTINHTNLLAITLVGEIGKRNDEVERGEERINKLWELAGAQRKYKTLAYPYGAYNDDLVGYIEDLGYDAAFSTQRTVTHSLDTRFILGRIGMT